MDIVEFSEKICGTKLNKWQKYYMRFLNDLICCYDVRIVMGKDGKVFTYAKPKELNSNGKTNVSK